LLTRIVQLKLFGSRDDSVTRLLRLHSSKGVKFPLSKVLFNAGGLLIGAVETTSGTVCRALAELFGRPTELAQACAAAAEPDPARFDGFIFEALRFSPNFPYFFRVCHTATQFAGGTPHARIVEPGKVVMICTHAAMFDEAAYPDPLVFDARRSIWQTFTLGYGHHECLGRAVAAVMIPEIARQVLRLPGIRAEGPLGIEQGAPEHLPLRWDA
jgi:cytochrome P450